jgi:hypothetical protein
MTVLTRRRCDDASDYWLIFYGDIQVGTIKTRSAILGIRRHGNGGAAFIPAVSRANV